MVSSAGCHSIALNRLAATHLSRHSFAIVVEQMLLFATILGLDLGRLTAVRTVQNDIDVGVLPEENALHFSGARKRELG